MTVGRPVTGPKFVQSFFLKIGRSRSVAQDRKRPKKMRPVRPFNITRINHQDGR